MVAGRHCLLVACERDWQPVRGRSVGGRLRRLARRVRAGEIAGIAVADHQAMVERVTGWAEGTEAIRRAGGKVLDARASGYLVRDAERGLAAPPGMAELVSVMADLHTDGTAEGCHSTVAGTGPSASPT